MQSVLVIDDEREVGQLIADTAKTMGIECLTTTDAVSFLHNLTPSRTLIFLDLVLPDIDGFELLRTLAQRHCKAGIVLMSGADQKVLEFTEECASTLNLKILGHLHKPFRIQDLERILETSGDKRNLAS
jgi:DNA-binding response OmpR family regulator